MYMSLLELQLAALLGKSLLRKNNELEQNLKKLQDFAEETISANQVKYYNSLVTIAYLLNLIPYS